MPPFSSGIQMVWASLVAQLVKNLPARRPQFNSWKIPWRREWLSTSVFWPGEFHGPYSPWGSQRVRHFLMAQCIKNLPRMQKTEETLVHSLGREDPLEKEMATHSSILAWKTPWTEEPGGLQSKGCGELDMTKHAGMVQRV